MWVNGDPVFAGKSFSWWVKKNAMGQLLLQYPSQLFMALQKSYFSHLRQSHERDNKLASFPFGRRKFLLIYRLSGRSVTTHIGPHKPSGCVMVFTE
ncbi:hypothetical protein [Microbulbifer rhizosphaerae]|uniref:Uncharacterized protein n=1 Tax=Microbulbifer rhizosphaerae TaxID=1562603 RepID=A0A7W4WF85_9GAMM|nr:hypothetical protein [Microbulbifer rhizosphaerae]MBB3063140.1 hypothetical protein [Microbulbifer rhizosphaerae]